MRTCGLCKRIPRRDDPLDFYEAKQEPSLNGGFFLVSALTNTPSVMALACRDCHGKPAPRYEWGCKMPKQGDGMNLEVCGLCRLALYEDDGGGRSIRVTQADLDAAGVILREGYRPGAYPVCRECYDLFRPIIHVRLVDNPPADAMGTGRGVVPPLAMFHGEWCL